MSEKSAVQNSTDFVDSAELNRRKTFNRNKWFFSLGGIGRDLSYQLIASFLLVYVQFGVSLTLAQFTTLSLIIGVGGRVWDAINDPMMGAIIEGTHMRWGKFKPWILIGAVSCGLVIISMFNIQSFTGWGFVVFMTIMYLLWESTFTMNDIGYWAMLPSLSSVNKERNSITMLTVLFAGIGAIIAQGVIPMISTGNVRASYRLISVAVVVAFILCQIMTSVFVKEQPHIEDKKGEKVSMKKMWKTIKGNDQILWMTLSMLFYNIGGALLVGLAANLLYIEIGYVGSIYTILVAAWGVTSVIINIIYPVLAEKLGRRKLQLISIICAIFGYIMVGLMGWWSFLPFNIVLLAIFAAFISAGQSMFYMASIINMTNCVEYNEYKQGERNEAVVSTLRPFMAKFADALKIGIITVVLAVSGVYVLSQSISTLEVQRDMFKQIATQQGQVEYIEKIQKYDTMFEGLTVGTPEYEEVVSQVKKLIENDKVMSSYQLDGSYVVSLGDAMVKRQIYNAGGVAVGQEEELGRLSDVSVTKLAEKPSTGSYKYILEIGENVSNGSSAADKNFKEKSTTSMRIWLRISVTVVPIIFLGGALLVQRKKFIIDEEYYDKMMEEINKIEKPKGE